MKIANNMNIGQLAEMIGTEATVEQAAKFRDCLIEKGYFYTDEVCEWDWLDLMGKCL